MAASEPAPSRSRHPEQILAEPTLAAPEDVLRTPPPFTAPEAAPAFDGQPTEPRQPPRETEGAEPHAAERPPGNQAAVWLGWAGTIILLMVLVWGAYVFRTEVVHVWPASERVYALLGVAPTAAPTP